MAAKIQGIPVYEARVEDEADGMVRISLVDDPGVMVNWQKFRSTPPSVQMYSVTDEERRIVRGVVMRADFPIFRRDPDGTEWYAIYHADTIRKMAEKYLAESRQNRVDTMHDGDEVRGVQMVQWFIKDTEAGINPSGFAEDIADGSLFAEFHITNDEVWDAVKAGTFRGFSLEGYFAFRQEQGQESIDKIVDELAGQFHITNMSKIERLKEILRAALAEDTKAEQKFGAITTNRGPLEWDGEEDLKAGDRVYIVDEEGNRVNATDGDYVTEDGKTIVVADGVVAEIRDPEAEVAPQEPEAPEVEAAAVNTDKGPIEWDGEEDLEAGREVFVLDEDGNRVPAPDGEYTTEDGKVIVVVEGRVAEIRDPEAEVDPEAAEIEELRKQLNEAKATIESLRAELKAAKQKPMAKPAHEEVKASAAPVKTGNARLDRLAELMAAK